MAVVELDTTPHLAGLLAGAARSALPWPDGSGSARPDGTLPDTTVVVRDVPVELASVADYAQVCGFRLRSTVPVTHPHLLGFPLTVWLLTRPYSPFGLLGLVHVANRITAHDPVLVGDRLDVTARTANARPHARGTQFDSLVEVRRDGEVVWTSTSTYLRRGAGPGDAGDAGDAGDVGDVGEADGTGPAAMAGATAAGRAETAGATAPTPGPRAGAAEVDVATLPLTARWSLPADLGRRYGAVSGDRNPIHLSTLSAKALGFPRAIAHGMWTKAAALAGLGNLPQPCTVDVAFKRPLLLPSTVEYATRRRLDGWDLGVRGAGGTPHLAGAVRHR